MSSLNQYIIGLSGHIDHGKTSLVKSLTGKNTDSLKEEIDRGMTINIGFAFLNDTITLIDVPGHEKFIKNMVAGVSSIDFALLVIAADDGIMPQTIEHFEILKLLNITDGAIIINKIDLVEKDWLELVENDIDDFVKGSFLSNKKIYKVSTINNEGIDELRQDLVNYNFKNTKTIKDKGVFRIFTDRVFSSKGFGTVVTGTVLSGKVKTGQKVKILPQNKIIKIRGLQSHDNFVDEISTGNRAALNLQYQDKISIKRGNHISEENYFTTYETAIVSIKILSKINKNIKNNDRLRVYLGTQEIMARIQLFEKKHLEPGQHSIGILKFEKPIIASFKDLFILRQFSPLITIGGGEIIDFNVFSKWKDNKNYIENFKNAKDDNDYIENIITYKFMNPYSIETLSIYLNYSEKLLKEIINKNKNIILIDKWILTLKQLKMIEKEIIKYFDCFHKSNPYRRGLLIKEALNSLNIDEYFLEHIFRYLLNKKLLSISNNLWSKKDFEISLTKKELEIINEINQTVSSYNLNAPRMSEISKILSKDDVLISKLINIEISNGALILISGELLFEKSKIELMIKSIKSYFNQHDSLDVSKFKDLTNTTRKYAVPLLEYLDRINLTYRIGNERKIKK